MDDDFGTPEAVSLLFDLVREGNRLVDGGQDAGAIAGAVEVIVDVLGIDDATRPPETAFSLGSLVDEFGLSGSTEEMIQSLIGFRDRARGSKDFATADAIRDGLESVGVLLEDGPDGTRWVRR
jgi:cysteinyl-tRNA synthetase